MNLKSRVKTLERSVRETAVTNEILKLRPTLDDYFTEVGQKRLEVWSEVPPDIREGCCKSSGKKLEDFL